MRAKLHTLGDSKYVSFRNHLYSFHYENKKTIRWSCSNRTGCAAYLLTSKQLIDGTYEIVDIVHVHLGHSPNGTIKEQNNLFLKNEMQNNLDTMTVNTAYEEAILKYPSKSKNICKEEVSSRLHRHRASVYYPTLPIDIPSALNIFDTTRFKFNMYQCQHELKKLKVQKQHGSIDIDNVDVNRLRKEIELLQLLVTNKTKELEEKQCIMDIIYPPNEYFSEFYQGSDEYQDFALFLSKSGVNALDTIDLWCLDGTKKTSPSASAKAENRILFKQFLIFMFAF